MPIMRRGIALSMIIGVTLTAGCSEERAGESGVIDHVTGAEKTRTYNKARSNIEDIKKDLKTRYQITD